MKKLMLLFITIAFSLAAFGQVTGVPLNFYLDPTCSDPAYQECSIEVGGYIYYSPTITKLNGTLDVVPSLNFENCTEWEQVIDNGQIIFQTVGGTGTREIELILTMDTEDQLPDSWAKFRIQTSRKLNYKIV